MREMNDNTSQLIARCGVVEGRNMFHSKDQLSTFTISWPCLFVLHEPGSTAQTVLQCQYQLSE